MHTLSLKELFAPEGPEVAEMAERAAMVKVKCTMRDLRSSTLEERANL